MLGAADARHAGASSWPCATLRPLSDRGLRAALPTGTTGRLWCSGRPNRSSTISSTRGSWCASSRTRVARCWVRWPPCSASSSCSNSRGRNLRTFLRASWQARRCGGRSDDAISERWNNAPPGNSGRLQKVPAPNRRAGPRRSTERSPCACAVARRYAAPARGQDRPDADRGAVASPRELTESCLSGSSASCFRSRRISAPSTASRTPLSPVTKPRQAVGIPRAPTTAASIPFEGGQRWITASRSSGPARAA